MAAKADNPIWGAQEDYAVTNFSAKIATKLMMLNVELGLGLGSASNYDLTVPSFSGLVSYDLPIGGLLETTPVAALRSNLFFEMMMLTSSPLENGTSDVMNMGMSVSYPFLF